MLKIIDRKRSRILALVTLLVGVSTAQAHSPGEHARVYFENIEDGAEVTSPVHLKFGIEGFGITPAGTKGKIRHTAGHHHLLIDTETLPDMDEPIPEKEGIICYGKGETEATIELSPGKHTLQLLLGDESHEPQDPPLLSKKITITVKPGKNE